MKTLLFWNGSPLLTADFHESEFHHGKSGTENDGHVLISGTCKHVPWHDKKFFADVITVKNVEMENFSWIIQVGLVQSHESFRAQAIAQLWSERVETVQTGKRDAALPALRMEKGNREPRNEDGL